MSRLSTLNSMAYCVAIVSVAILLAFNARVSEGSGGLKLGFYEKSCPSAEMIVKSAVEKVVAKAPTLAATFLRMHFHDCFVRGCDGSVLLNSTKSNKSEKDATPNLTLRGFNVIDNIKAQVEKQCPGVVSCADVLTLVARDAVLAAFGGPFWEVPTGRRDGVKSIQSEALSNIPAPTSNFTQLKTSFSRKGLNVKDLVVLSGAHTIGIAHCSSFSNRLYNFTGKGDMDPSLDKFYAAELKTKKCKSLADNTTIVEMDPGSFLTFDTHYYTNLVKRRGLFQSDAALLTDGKARKYVSKELVGSPVESISRFFLDFRQSMEKMGRIGVLTGSAGEIRKTCPFVNS
eukprot:Gb_18532 [translate_table: standard]